MTSQVARKLKNQASTALARLVRRERLTPSELRDLRPSSILIVRQHNQMGDMVCATPALRAIGETWPGARLTLVTAPVNVEVVRHNPLLHDVITFEARHWRRPWDLLRFMGRLRGVRAELAFVLSSVSFSVTSAGLGLASGARWVVGSDSRPFGWDLSEVFSLEMPAQPLLDRHAVEHSLAPLAALGIRTDDRSTLVVPAVAEQAAASRLVAELELGPGFWALHPGAGKDQNVWPATGFAAVARRAVAAGRCVLVLHGPADARAISALRHELGTEIGRGVRVAPSVSVGVAAALLARCERFLCNDTGIMHVAGALPVPTVALFGPTDPGLWKPPTDAVLALTSPRQTVDPRGPEYGWMENITPAVVWEAWNGLPGAACGQED